MSNILIAVVAVANVGALPTGNDAWALALADAQKLPKEAVCYTRYVWFPDGDINSVLASVYTLNETSRSSVPYRPPLIGKDRLMMLRVDLRRLSQRESDVHDYIAIWEDFQFDPKLSRLFTRDFFRFNALVLNPVATRWVERACEPYTHKDGKTYRSKWVREEFTPTKADLEHIDVIRTVGESLNHGVVTALNDLTGSEASVVSDRYFVTRALSSIKNKGLYAVLYGGRYYDLVGFKRNVKGKTDLEGVLESVGIQNAEKLFDELRSDQKIAIFRSQVTGKPRAVKIFHTPSGRNGTGTFRISEDLKDDSIDIGTHPMMNLLKFNFDGQEALFEAPNGTQRRAAFNGKGALVEEVPFDIANDRTIPSPHSLRLQTISCIICHGPQDGVQQLTNDVHRVAKRTNILGDKGVIGDPDVIDRLAGLYGGDPKKLLARVRDDYASAVLAATGPWAKASPDQSDIVRVAAKKIEEIRREQWYDLITTERACEDLRIELTKEEPPAAVAAKGAAAVREWRAVKSFRDALLINPPPLGFEDVRVAALLDGLGLNRAEYDLVRDFIEARIKK